MQSIIMTFQEAKGFSSNLDISPNRSFPADCWDDWHAALRHSADSSFVLNACFIISYPKTRATRFMPFSLNLDNVVNRSKSVSTWFALADCPIRTYLNTHFHLSSEHPEWPSQQRGLKELLTNQPGFRAELRNMIIPQEVTFISTSMPAWVRP